MDIVSSLVKGSKEYRELEQQYKKLVQRTAHILDAEESVKQLRQLLDSLQSKYNTTLARHNELLATIAAMEEDEELIECGIYRPAYSFDFATVYKLKLDNIRDLQKQKVKDKAAVTVKTGNTATKGETNRLVNLVLRAFNGECDALASKVTWKNVSKTLEQVGRAAQAINKLVESHDIQISQEYITLKLNEICLLHEYQEKRQAELDAERANREEMREEEKARREFEKALQEATQEQERIQRALAEAQARMASARDEELDRLNETVALLLKKLEGAKEKGLRAQSMAELTKSGHVYIISNVGSFGDKIFKIGMTRRLEPEDRVAELGDASVPFKFDIHAMVYSKDAPSLEAKLHQHFKARQVNLVNDRKEFFYADLDEIERAVRSLGAEIKFVRVPEAKDYRESRALRTQRKQGEELATKGA
ncbi:MAG TPA: DUF4041 domain-containing protein [Candidatus Hydrogenedentes bacterium]|nr:DUF4041 domain-containing protein [Candidatus Hydrogenedentota bacterium]HNT87009.1 DUF4041 domain-containing protein [Candidatus Hydrogenedentota bacterium]